MEWNERRRLCYSCLLSAFIMEAVFVISSVIYLHTTRNVAALFLVGNVSQASGRSQSERRFLWYSTTPGPPRYPSTKTTEKTPEEFLKEFEAFCRRKTVIYPPNNTLDICPCIPKSLLGNTPVQKWSLPFGELELIHPELLPGGRWRPRDCIARHRVAIIVPFRDREQHLRVFIQRMHPFLQRQQLDYQIFVVEQAMPTIFNKAMMMNVGFKEARLMYNFDCYIFHDVDMLPEDDRNMYACSQMPRHVGSHCDKWNYTVPYKDIFGGAISLTPLQFQHINGFSNEFYGWGGEDDDMFHRVVSRKYKVVRYPATVARYTMLKHDKDRGNPYNSDSSIAWKWRPRHYLSDGLNSLKYSRLKLELRPLYTWIYTKVAPPPKPVSQKKKAEGTSVVSSSGSLPNHVLTYWGAIILCILMCLHRIVTIYLK